MSLPDRFDTDQLAAIRAEAKRELDATATRIRRLTNRAAILASQTEHERDQLASFVAQFALELESGQRLHLETATSDALVVDTKALRAQARRLDVAVARAAALRDHLVVARAILQASADTLAADEHAQPDAAASNARLRQAMNEAREDERRRLAREIHDGPAQVLANTILAVKTLALIARRDPACLADELDSVVTLLEDGVAEIRRFMFDLQPAMLEEQGIAPTLRRYVDDYSRFFGKRVTLTIEEPLPELSAAEQLAIFRIVQEALQNVQKHAGADAAGVELATRGDAVCLAISDAGRGFSPSKAVARTSGGAGVPGMRERAKLIGAVLSVESAPGAGTTVTMVLPYRVEDDAAASVGTQE